MSDTAQSEQPPEQPAEQPPAQPPEAAGGQPSAEPSALSDLPVDINGTSDLPPMDPAAVMNGFPMDPDPNFMPAPIDPLEAGMLPIPDMQPMQPMSADEIALYDRQIRLWGVQAQEKIRSANILLIGLKGLGTEIAKNLVLAGIGTLTILDHELVTDDDLGTQFFVPQDQVGQNRAEAAQAELQKLNPRVNLFVDTDVVFTKFPEYFSSFDITIATGVPFEALQQINMYCRNFNRKFYAADTHGMLGYIFSDLVLHQFVVEKEQSNKPTAPNTIETGTRSIISVTQKTENGKKLETVTKQELYSPLLLANSSPLPADLTRTPAKKRKVTPLLSCLRALFDFQRETGGRLPAHNRADLELFTRLVNEKHLELQLPPETLRSDFLRMFLQNLGAEISPAVAFLGGHLAQDVINVLGQREQPLQNFLLFDGEQFQANTFSIHPVFDDSVADGMDMSVGTNGTADMAGPSVGAGLEMNGTMAAA